MIPSSVADMAGRYGRLNGVDLVLVPLLGTGLIQPVQCFGATAIVHALAPAASHSQHCFPDRSRRVYRADLNARATLLQPDFPGINAISAGAGEALDPNFRPNQIDSFDFSIQRQLTRRTTLEIGYIGRRITHEYQPINLNAVPYMMTQGGQQFAPSLQERRNATVRRHSRSRRRRLQRRWTWQPQSRCGDATALLRESYEPGLLCRRCELHRCVVANEVGNFTTAQVWSLWSDLDGGAGCTGCPTNNGPAQGFKFGNTMMNTLAGPLTAVPFRTPPA